ncbi:hypothetical protein PWT90_11272 [Aphanocladium album]|nr:hypothetical protein PWT90_11272 [Aphanocladium album]
MAVTADPISPRLSPSLLTAGVAPLSTDVPTSTAMLPDPAIPMGDRAAVATAAHVNGVDLRARTASSPVRTWTEQQLLNGSGGGGSAGGSKKAVVVDRGRTDTPRQQPTPPPHEDNDDEDQQHACPAPAPFPRPQTKSRRGSSNAKAGADVDAAVAAHWPRAAGHPAVL